MLSSPRRPSSTMRIFSSAEWCRRVARRISRTVFSALSGTRLLACLIVAPQQGYDEPGILSYAIRPFCPTSADGPHPRYFRGTLRGASGKLFHAIGDNLRQLHYLLAQFSAFRNVALNTVAISLQ